MGKRITQQARGRGGPAYRVRKKAYRYRISFPALNVEGIGIVNKLINSPGHTAPLAELKISNNKFFIPAAEGIFEGKEFWIGKRAENKDAEPGDILKLKDIPQGTKVFNVENRPGDGGKYLRSAGGFGTVINRDKGVAELLIKRRQLKLNENSRAVMGVVAGAGRKMKPIVKAGKRYHMMKALGRKWHRTSAVKVNAVDHPFGGGRGKRIKSKIAKRNAPAGAKVGHIRPRKTGRGK